MGESRQRLIRVFSRLTVLGALALAAFFTQASPHVVNASLHISTVDATGRVALGDSHTCAITNVNKIWCWGDNSSYQLGVGSGGSAPADSAVPIETISLAGGRIAKAIAAGSVHTCALATDGTVWCWGGNGAGQIGDTTLISKGQPTQVAIAAPATMIAAGGNSTCAVLNDNRVQCWGKNQYGQLGINTDGTTETSPQFVSHIPNWFTVAHIEIGANHTCATSAAGAAWCWGYFLDGRLGTSQSSNVVVPAATSSLGGTALTISAGGAHTCAVLANGTLTCFGKNNNGQIGQSLSTVSSSTPTAVAFSGTASVASLGSDFTCAAMTSGGVECFGANGFGQVGNGSTSTRVLNSTSVIGVGGSVVDVVAGLNHACAIKATGELLCWGNNDFGKTGSNTGNLVETSAVTVGSLNVMPTTTTTLPTTTTTAAPAVSTTPPSVLSDAGITTSSTATTLPTVLIKTVSLKRGARISASRVAQAVSMTIPKTSQGSMRIVIISGDKYCAFSGTSIMAKRAGKCVIAVSLLPKKGKTITRRTSIVVR